MAIVFNFSLPQIHVTLAVLMVLFEAALETICTRTALGIARKNSNANNAQIRTHMYISYILQPPKYLIIVVNQFRYINNSFTKDRCSITMDTTVVLGLHKFSLQATIDHHGPYMYSGHYTTSVNCCKIHSIATTLKFRSLKWLMPKTHPRIDYVMFFGLEQEDGSCDYSHGAGTSSPYHWKQVEE